MLHADTFGTLDTSCTRCGRSGHGLHALTGHTGANLHSHRTARSRASQILSCSRALGRAQHPSSLPGREARKKCPRWRFSLFRPGNTPALQTNRRADARTDGRGQTKVWTSLAHSDRTPWTPLARFPDTLDRGVHARTDVFLFCPRFVELGTFPRRLRN